MKVKMPFACKECGKESIGHRTRVFCSHVCSSSWLKKNRVKTVPADTLPTGTKGAIGEIEVAAHLMRNGYHVFRAMSPSCPCDLIAIIDDDIFRVEVRVGSITPYNGRRYFYPIDSEKSDLLAVVYSDGIQYLKKGEPWNPFFG